MVKAKILIAGNSERVLAPQEHNATANLLQWKFKTIEYDSNGEQERVLTRFGSEPGKIDGTIIVTKVCEQRRSIKRVEEIDCATFFWYMYSLLT